jgi:hypothetical protein
VATSRGSVACCASWVTGARCLPQPTLHQRANPTAASRPMAASNHVLGACALRRFTHSTAGATRAGRDNRASPFRLTLLLPWDNVAAEPVWYINRLSSPFVSQMTATNRSVSIVVSIPACHAGDLGSIPRRIGIPRNSPTTTGWSLSTFCFFEALLLPAPGFLLRSRPALRRGGCGARDFCSHSQVEGLTP